MDAKLETGVPIPPEKRRERSYPALYTMAVGQSFAKPLAEYTRLHAASQQCRKQTGRLFTMRQLETTCRIWRIG